MYRLFLLLILFVCYCPVSTAEESRPSQMTQNHMVEYGINLGTAEICGFSRTKEFESRVRKSLDASKWIKADKDLLWQLFEMGRKKIHDNPDLTASDLNKEYCDMNKGIISESAVFKDNFKIGDR